MKHLLISTLIIFIFQPAMAQKSRFKVFKEDSQNRALIHNNRNISFFYKKVSWNQQATEIEFGYMYLRDRDTKKIYELRLSETKPDSGVFNVDFPVGVFQEPKIAAEIYSAPQSMLKDKGRIGLIKDLIEDGSVKRKPFLLRVLRAKGQILDIFDSKQDAIAAYNKYRKEMGLTPEGLESQSIVEVANQQKVKKKKIIDTSTLQSLFLANENSIEATNEKNKELREVMRNIELKRRKLVVANGTAWSSSQAQSNSSKANDLIRDGVTTMKKNKFKDSMESFFKASDLNPKNEDIYQQYGISLFRNKKYNQSIVVLDISNPSAARIQEKNFYIGMSFYNLKDYENAVKYFDMVMKSGNKSFGPTAAFYKGSALLEMNEFDQSKKAFQYVLDNSKNAEMDKRAEKFIEYGLDRKAFRKEKVELDKIEWSLGLIYDSNIILADDQLLGASDVTNENGWRILGSVTPRFRPFYSDSDEINIDLNVTTLKSFDEGFGSNETAEQADPLVMSITVPWTHRTTLNGKGYFFDLSPGYETIIMDLNGTGNATISNSIKLDFDNTLVISKNWIAKGLWSFASIDSNILGEEEDADAIAGSLKLSSIFILNKDMERYLIPEFAFKVNAAKDSTYAFNRIDLGVTFTTSVWNSFGWNSKLAYYLANYESTRTDNNYSLSTGLTAKVTPHWTWGGNLIYAINDSTTNRYDKYSVMSTMSFSY